MILLILLLTLFINNIQSINIYQIYSFGNTYVHCRTNDAMINAASSTTTSPFLGNYCNQTLDYIINDITAPKGYSQDSFSNFFGASTTIVNCRNLEYNWYCTQLNTDVNLNLYPNMDAIIDQGDPVDVLCISPTTCFQPSTGILLGDEGPWPSGVYQIAFTISYFQNSNNMAAFYNKIGCITQDCLQNSDYLFYLTKCSSVVNTNFGTGSLPVEYITLPQSCPISNPYYAQSIHSCTSIEAGNYIYQPNYTANSDTVSTVTSLYILSKSSNGAACGSTISTGPIEGGTGFTFSCTTTTGGILNTVTLISGGYGYTAAPTYNFDGGNVISAGLGSTSISGSSVLGYVGTQTAYTTHSNAEAMTAISDPSCSLGLSGAIPIGIDFIERYFYAAVKTPVVTVSPFTYVQQARDGTTTIGYSLQNAGDISTTTYTSVDGEVNGKALFCPNADSYQEIYRSLGHGLLVYNFSSDSTNHPIEVHYNQPDNANYLINQWFSQGTFKNYIQYSDNDVPTYNSTIAEYPNGNYEPPVYVPNVLRLGSTKIYTNGAFFSKSDPTNCDCQNAESGSGSSYYNNGQCNPLSSYCVPGHCTCTQTTTLVPIATSPGYPLPFYNTDFYFVNSQEDIPPNCYQYKKNFYRANFVYAAIFNNILFHTAGYDCSVPSGDPYCIVGPCPNIGSSVLYQLNGIENNGILGNPLYMLMITYVYPNVAIPQLVTCAPESVDLNNCYDKYQFYSSFVYAIITVVPFLQFNIVGFQTVTLQSSVEYCTESTISFLYGLVSPTEPPVYEYGLNDEVCLYGAFPQVQYVANQTYKTSTVCACIENTGWTGPLCAICDATVPWYPQNNVDRCDITCISPDGLYLGHSACLNGATCQYNVGANQAYCNCTAGYSGEYCQFPTALNFTCSSQAFPIHCTLGLTGNIISSAYTCSMRQFTFTLPTGYRTSFSISSTTVSFLPYTSIDATSIWYNPIVNSNEYCAIAFAQFSESSTLACPVPYSTLDSFGNGETSDWCILNSAYQTFTFYQSTLYCYSFSTSFIYYFYTGTNNNNPAVSFTWCHSSLADSRFFNLQCLLQLASPLQFSGLTSPTLNNLILNQCTTSPSITSYVLLEEVPPASTYFNCTTVNNYNYTNLAAIITWQSIPFTDSDVWIDLIDQNDVSYPFILYQSTLDSHGHYYTVLDLGIVPGISLNMYYNCYLRGIVNNNIVGTITITTNHTSIYFPYPPATTYFTCNTYNADYLQAIFEWSPIPGTINEVFLTIQDNEGNTVTTQTLDQTTLASANVYSSIVTFTYDEGFGNGFPYYCLLNAIVGYNDEPLGLTTSTTDGSYIQF